MQKILLSGLFGLGLLVGGCAHQNKAEHCEVCDTESVQQPTTKEKSASKAVEEDEVIVKADQVPANVTAAFERTHPGAKVSKIEKENKTGIDCYDFKFTKDGKDGEAKFNAKGEAVASD